MAIKLGMAGAYYQAADGTEGIADSVRIAHVVDTVGAGDSFAVGVVSALLKGLSPDLVVARDNRIGALATQVIGDSEGLPTRVILEVLEQTARATCEPEPISSMQHNASITTHYGQHEPSKETRPWQRNWPRGAGR